MRPHLHQSVRGYMAANRSQVSVNKLLQTFVRIRWRIQEEPANSLQRTVLASDSRHHRALIKGLRAQLNASGGHRHELRAQLGPAQNTSPLEKKTSRALFADYYCMPNSCKRRATDTEEKKKIKLVRPPEFCVGFSFHQCWYNKDVDYSLVP